MRDVRDLFQANYANYVSTYNDPSFGCNSDRMNPNPVPLTRVLTAGGRAWLGSI